jgi:hypothetical protein
MLKNCRQFYRTYPQIRKSLSGEFAAIPSGSAIRESVTANLSATVEVHQHQGYAPEPETKVSALELALRFLRSLFSPFAFREIESLDL